jgi:hypothetical protein
MKPLGMAFAPDASLHVLKPSRVEDKVWDAVQEAIIAGWTPRQFVSEAADAWSQELRNEAREKSREFGDMLATKLR